MIVSENLQIKNMVKNHHLAKSISDVSWYELTRQLCFVCGYRNTDTKDLSVREWTCPVCGAKHDRDVNVAKNILAEGLQQTA